MRTLTRTSRLLVGAVASVTFAVMAVAPASAAPAPAPLGVGHSVSYVALGDSYAYGLGADNPATQSYPAILATRAHLTLTNAAVPGATTYDVTHSQVPSNHTALEKAGLVTLTVGGDDLDAIGVAAICATQPAASCQAAIAGALAKLPQLYTSLGVTLRTIRDAAPHARIVVTGYPELLDPSLGQVAQELNAAALALNTTIWAAVRESQVRGSSARFVSVVEPFLGHGLGSTDPWINSSGVGAFHPTTTGYLDGYYASIARDLACRPFLITKAA
jgi:lysophospholipase L1-like esterase